MRCLVSKQGKNGVWSSILTEFLVNIQYEDFANADLHTSHTKVTNVCIYIFATYGQFVLVFITKLGPTDGFP